MHCVRNSLVKHSAVEIEVGLNSVSCSKGSSERPKEGIYSVIEGSAVQVLLFCAVFSFISSLSSLLKFLQIFKWWVLQYVWKLAASYSTNVFRIDHNSLFFCSTVPFMWYAIWKIKLSKFFLFLHFTIHTYSFYVYSYFRFPASLHFSMSSLCC